MATADEAAGDEAACTKPDRPWNELVPITRYKRGRINLDQGSAQQNLSRCVASGHYAQMETRLNGTRRRLMQQSSMRGGHQRKVGAVNQRRDKKGRHVLQLLKLGLGQQLTRCLYESAAPSNNSSAHHGPTARRSACSEHVGTARRRHR